MSTERRYTEETYEGDRDIERRPSRRPGKETWRGDLERRHREETWRGDLERRSREETWRGDLSRRCMEEGAS